MGHIINPVTNRVRLSNFWKSSWSYSASTSYKYLFLNDLLFYKFISILIKSKFIEEANILFGDFYFFKKGKKIKIFFTFFFPFFLMEKKNILSYRKRLYSLLSYFLFFENIFFKNRKSVELLDLKKEYLFLRKNTLGSNFLKNETPFSLLSGSFSEKYFIFLKEVKEGLDIKGKGEFVKSTVSRKPLFYGLKDFVLRANLGYEAINHLVLRVLFFEYNIIYIYRFLQNLSKFYMLYFLNNIFKYYLKNITSNQYTLDLSFVNLNVQNFNSLILINFLRHKLKNGHSLISALNLLVKDLNKSYSNGLIKGYKIKVSGRYSRKERGNKVWFKLGSIPLNSFGTPLNYSCDFFRTRYGIAGIKIWLNI